MRILFDQGVPVPLQKHLPGHDIKTAYELGWSELSSGELLSRAEEAFDLLVTTDRNLRFQQNLVGRRLAVLVLPTTSWPNLQRKLKQISTAIAGIQPGQYVELT